MAFVASVAFANAVVTASGDIVAGAVAGSVDLVVVVLGFEVPSLVGLCICLEPPFSLVFSV